MKKSTFLCVVMSVILITANLFVSKKASASAAFARQTGLSCTACHTVFPRLTYFGEKFMRNGFALPTEAKQEKNDDQSNLTVIQDLSKVLSVRGKINLYSAQSPAGEDYSALGNTIFGAIFVSGQIAKNIPIWMEFEDNTANGELELHNYAIGRTNLFGSTMLNVRVGGFTPTEWTSFSDQKRMFDAKFSHPAALRPNKFKNKTVDRWNLGTTTALEYYGYKGGFFWAVGVTDNMGGNFHATSSASKHKDLYWLLRAEMPSGALAGSSVSLLTYHSNLGAENDGTADGSFLTMDVSANLRFKNLDFVVAYVTNSNRNIEDGMANDVAISAEADYKINAHFTGMVRFDNINDGTIIVDGADKVQSYIGPGLVFSPKENIRITGSYEIDSSDNSEGGEYGEHINYAQLELQFMF